MIENYDRLHQTILAYFIRGKYHGTADLLIYLFGLSCFAAEAVELTTQNIKTTYSETSPYKVSVSLLLVLFLGKKSKPDDKV